MWDVCKHRFAPKLFSRTRFAHNSISTTRSLFVVIGFNETMPAYIWFWRESAFATHFLTPVACCAHPRTTEVAAIPSLWSPLSTDMAPSMVTLVKNHGGEHTSWPRRCSQTQTTLVANHKTPNACASVEPRLLDEPRLLTHEPTS